MREFFVCFFLGLCIMKSQGQNNDVALSTTDNFLYDGEILHHYGLGFHNYLDVVNGSNLYASGFFGIDLFTGGQNRLRISQKGNVGIGTTNISDKLVVSNGIGEIRIGGGNGKTLSAYNSGSLSNLDIFANSTYLNSNMILGSKKIISLYNNAGNIQDYAMMQINNAEGLTFNINSHLAMALTNNGLVGIGTSSPNYKLEVNGDVSVGSNNDQVTGYGNRLYFSGINEVTDPIYINRYNPEMNSSELRINIGDDRGGQDKFVIGNIYWEDGKWHPFMSVTNSGNVGIGTTNPRSRFVVQEGVNASSLNSMALGFNRNVADGQIFDTSRSAWQFSARDDRFTLEGYNGADAAPLTVLKNGNIGIGTPTPSGKLDVNGTIRAKEVVVTEAGWADFVFDKNYKLRDLKEVDQYIQDNGHLPEIPSAAEVKEKGVNLVEVQAKLLQKVEEMTLYIIELKKDIEQLKSRTRKQDAK